MVRHVGDVPAAVRNDDVAHEVVNLEAVVKLELGDDSDLLEGQLELYLRSVSDLR